MPLSAIFKIPRPRNIPWILPGSTKLHDLILPNSWSPNTSCVSTACLLLCWITAFQSQEAGVLFYLSVSKQPITELGTSRDEINDKWAREQARRRKDKWRLSCWGSGMAPCL
jgi:hypothetical protein